MTPPTTYPARDLFVTAIGEPFEMTEFEAKGDGIATTVTLVSAEPAGVPAAPEARAPFSLLFVGTADRPLPQGIWHLEHRSLGAMDVFLVPVRHEGGIAYEAVFA